MTPEEARRQLLAAAKAILAERGLTFGPMGLITLVTPEVQIGIDVAELEVI